MELSVSSLSLGPTSPSKIPDLSGSGWLCLDKPSGISSNFAMSRVRRIFCNKETAATGISKRSRDFRMGYIGTLDPFATGVLPIAIGEARKFIPYVSEAKKTYIFTMVFGTETDSLDVDGNIISTSDRRPSAAGLEDVLPQFCGDQQQMPPKFSAIKINGERACDMMRQGKNVELQQRSVRIFSLKILNVCRENPTVPASSDSLLASATLEVVCSKGTYVRSLARDIALKLGTIAFVKALRRTKSGPFDISYSISLEKLQEIEDTRSLMDFVKPLESPLDDIPALYLSAEESIRLQNGLVVFPESGLENLERSKDGNVLIFENSVAIFRGIGMLLGNDSVKAVRMLSPNFGSRL